MPGIPAPVSVAVTLPEICMGVVPGLGPRGPALAPLAPTAVSNKATQDTIVIRRMSPPRRVWTRPPSTRPRPFLPRRPTYTLRELASCGARRRHRLADRQEIARCAGRCRVDRLRLPRAAARD